MISFCINFLHYNYLFYLFEDKITVNKYLPTIFILSQWALNQPDYFISTPGVFAEIPFALKASIEKKYD